MGSWLSATQLRLEIRDATGATAEIELATVSVIGSLTTAVPAVTAYASLPSRSVSPVLQGNWGTKPGPTITALIASDPDNLDGVSFH